MKSIDRNALAAGLVATLSLVLATPVVTRDGKVCSAGLPAKTGVGGGIAAVVPGRFAIAAFSPRLNEAGNSIRSLQAIRDIAGALGVGVFGSNAN